MIEELSLQTVLTYLTLISVPVGVFYHIITLRNQSRTRQAQLFMQLYQRSISEEANRSWWKHVTMTFDDYSDFDRKIGPNSPDGAVKIHTLWQQYQGVGLLLRDGLINHEMAYGLTGGWRAVMLWLRWKQTIREMRKRYNNIDYLDGFEYLGTEMMKYREKKGLSNELSEEFIHVS